MGAVSWILLVAVGFGLMWSMRYTAVAKLDAVLVRASAFTFMAAGMVGGQGWLGGMIDTLMGWVQTVGADAGTTMVGASVSWIVAAGLGAAWVLTMLPAKVFAKDPPDWMVVSGLLLPSLLASVPGPLGEGLRAVVQTCGGLMTAAVSQAVS